MVIVLEINMAKVVMVIVQTIVVQIIKTEVEVQCLEAAVITLLDNKIVIKYKYYKFFK